MNTRLENEKYWIESMLENDKNNEDLRNTLRFIDNEPKMVEMVLENVEDFRKVKQISNNKCGTIIGYRASKKGMLYTIVFENELDTFEFPVKNFENQFKFLD